MPNADQLPDDLKELHYRNAVELTHARWKSDVQFLIRALRPYLDDPLQDQARPATARMEAPQRSIQPSTGTLAVTTAAGIQKFEAQTLERVSKELAAYIGPISETIVKRAAKRCTSVEDLCGAVAQEIEGDAARARFLKSCRS
jgi:response regulator RpfG family c-di-GMP phosphodiesterase